MRANHPIIVEACVGNLDDALAAARLGADRLEFCAALEVGGLTPDFDMVRRLRETVAIPVVAMVRPRAGGFHYSEDEWRGMLEDAERLMALGAEGVVFGVLTADRAVDAARVRAMVAAVRRQVGRAAVFHKAIDEAADPAMAWTALKTAGVDRVLSSGGAATAAKGAEAVRRMVEDSQANEGSPEVLVGGGVRAENVAVLLRRMGARQVHAACTADGPMLRFDPAKFRALLSAVHAFETR